MALKFGDIAGLELKLEEQGRQVVQPIEQFLRDVTEWFDGHADSSSQVVVEPTAFATLCERARVTDDEKVRNVALGALEFARTKSQVSPDQVRFSVRFALRLIRLLTGRERMWSNVSITEQELAEARQLFEVARGDDSYSHGELAAAVESFAAKHSGRADMFGRLASDLGLLLAVLRDDSREAAQREAAQREAAYAALVYFAIVSDAIPDNLGLVGFLDDAFIVRAAVDEIEPGRGALGAFLDRIIHRWPFIVDLVLESPGTTYRLSEFMVVNVALLLEHIDSRSDHDGTALVVPRSGPLPFLLAFVRALSDVVEHVGNTKRPLYQRGERLANRDGKRAEIEFDAYLKGESPAFEECDPDEATYFRAKHPGRKRGSSVTRIRPVEDIVAFERSAKEAGNLRRGNLTMESSRIHLGARERLFGSVMPITLPVRGKRVVVVSALKDTELLARSLTMYGEPLIDVLPMGQARVEEDHVIERVWTKGGAGGNCVITVVRRTADALEIAEDPEKSVQAVVVAVRARTTDMLHLRQLSALGIRVVAIVEQRDLDSQGALAEAGFDFWQWDEETLGRLRWPTSAEADGAEGLQEYERECRVRSAASVSVTHVKSDALDEACSTLKQLESLSRDNEDERLATAVEDGLRLLWHLWREIDPQPVREPPRFKTFADAFSGTGLWWSDAELDAGRTAVSALKRGIDQLRERNPKYEAIIEWSNSHAGGVVVCPWVPSTNLMDELENLGVRWVPRLERTDLTEAVLIPGWLRQERMEPLLVPPISRDVTLLLYESEGGFNSAFQKRHHRGAQKVRNLVKRRAPFDLLSSGAPAPEEIVPSRDVEAFFIDEFEARTRRVRALQELSSIEGETVPAYLVYFSGGHWAAFAPSYRVYTATHLLDRTDDEADDISLRTVSAEELDPGDLVVLLRGSHKDALRAEVDARLGVQVRETAAEWRYTLQRFLDDGHSMSELCSRLASEGCKRGLQTVRAWVSDDNRIGPHGAFDGTLDAIQRATKDEILAKRLVDCEHAIAELRSAHISMARELANQVRERAHEWLEIGAGPDELVELEDRLVLLTVASREHDRVDVPRAAINRLRESV